MAGETGDLWLNELPGRRCKIGTPAVRMPTTPVGRIPNVCYNAGMTAKLNEDIAEAVNRQDRPLEVLDAAGKVYIVMTSQQFQKYVYDDSELTSDEMLAAAAQHLDDPEGWGAPGRSRGHTSRGGPEATSLERPR